MSKEQHYWLQLRAALAAGLWRTQHPARAYNATTPLSWPELLRKFNKHCGANASQHLLVAHIAHHTRTLASLLDDDNDDGAVENTAGSSLKMGSECMLRSQDQLQDAATAYAALQALLHDNKNAPTNSLHFVLAYYAYALGKPEECLEHLVNVPDIPLIQNHIPVVSQDPPHSHAPSLFGHSSSRAEPSLISISSASSPPSLLPEIQDGRACAMAEAFRSICLQGMSHERSYPSDPRRALRAYLSAVPLFTILTSEFTLSSTTTTTSTATITQPAGKFDFTPFFQLREMWHWVERLLWRAVVLSSRLCHVHQDPPTESLWSWFTHYTSCSAAWPSTFRTAHRSTISTLFLRAFVLRYRVLSPSPVSKGKWVSQARSLVQDYRAILGSSTQFPKAGERNRRVEELVDLCVAIWEAASGGIGEYAGWVIDILWWATRYTFNSPRIYRHMTRLFHLAGDTPLAIRTLKLYVQIVGKAWLVAQKNKQQRQQDGTTNLSSDDEESDEQWVEMMIFGVRMLCRFAATANESDAMDELRYAETLIQKARERLDGSEENKRVVANLWIAEGIWNSVMALREEDPYTRPHRLQQAHDCFMRSIEVKSTPVGYYHLALSFSRVTTPFRGIKRAVECAGMALEGEPREIRYWHLLGLLLTVEERWKEAEEVLERGAELDRELGGLDEGGQDEEEATVVDDNGNELSTATSSPVEEPTTTPAQVHVLEEGHDHIPPASELLRSMLEPSPPSRREVYEYSLQLRMTQVALVEVVKGAEGAEMKWVDVFGWIAERRRGEGGVLYSSEHSHRLSMESSAPLSMMGRKTFVTGGGTMVTVQGGDGGSGSEDRTAEVISLDGREEEVHEQQQQPAPATAGSPLIVSPIPITISPATPEPGTLHHEHEHEHEHAALPLPEDGEKEKEKEKEKTKMNGLRVKRSASIDRVGGGGDTSKSKKMQQMLKDHVHKGRAGISAVSRKIGHGVSKHHGLHLRRSNSSPNFHEVIRNASYQASSIHSRRRLGSFIQFNDRTPTASPPPPQPPLPPPPPASQSSAQTEAKVKVTSWQAKENRMLSDLWLMSAATFRRLGKIEQAKGAIQEAEVRDEGNPGVWVQLGLYYMALEQRQHAIDALQKALFMSTDDIAATIHLSRLYLMPVSSPSASSSSTNYTTSTATTGDTSPTSTLATPSEGKGSEVDRSNVDLAAGLLAHLTRGKGWDVPEAWYFLAKAYGMQGGRREREREALRRALEVEEGRGVRDVGCALGWCI